MIDDRHRPSAEAVRAAVLDSPGHTEPALRAAAAAGAGPIGDGLRAMLGFLEILTLRPDELGPSDAGAVRAAGVSDQAMVDAVHVAAAFNTIDRIADATGFRVPTAESFQRGARMLLERGYV